jgi:hypothetical protein
MKTVYIVEGQTGEYSDHTEWSVAAYEFEPDAQEHVKLAEDWARSEQVLDGKDNLCDMSYSDRLELKNPYDPDMRVDYTGVRYHYYSIRLYTGFREYLPVERLVRS